MKKFLKTSLVLLILVFSITCFSACKIFIYDEITSISFTEDEITISKGEEKLLPLNIKPDNFTEEIEITSSNENIVKINGTNIIGVDSGTAVVTVTTKINKKTASIIVNVRYLDLKTLTISHEGVLNQISDKDPMPLKFFAIANKHTDPNLKFQWNLYNKTSNEIITSFEGKIFNYIMPKDIGKTYVLKLSCGDKTACIEFGYYNPMREVALAEPDEFILGKESGLVLNWPNDCNQNPKIKWHIAYDGNEDIKISNDKPFNYVPKLFTEHEIYAIVDGVKSNTINLIPEYDTEIEIQLESDRKIIKLGNKQRFFITSNICYINPDTALKVVVYKNNLVKETKDLKASEFNMDFIDIQFDETGKFDIFIKINEFKSNILNIKVETILPALNTINLKTEDNLIQSGFGGQVTVKALCEPIESEFKNLKWYVNDNLVAENVNEFLFNPSGTGEFHIQGIDGNIKSKYLTVVSTNNNDNLDKYINEHHSYGGYLQNYYITNQREMNNIIHFTLANHLYGSRYDQLKIYVDYGKGINVSEKVSEARGLYPEAGILPGYSYTNTDVGNVEINFDYSNINVLNPNKKTKGEHALPQDPISKPKYENIVGSNRPLYVDNLPHEIDVTTSNMLYKAVQWGYKPNIVGDYAEQINNVYDKAKEILRQIISDDMTDYDKVLAIYDWICYNVAYDKDLFLISNENKENLTETMQYNGYYLEGVFLDNQAVCDGKSKAFVLLCGMEGIHSMRVSGTANGGGHAWNKVLLDADSNGNKEWYVVDSTWGDSEIDNSEILNHAYFLLADDEINASHEESEHDYPEAENDFNYYDTIEFTHEYFDKLQRCTYQGDMYIDSKEELIHLFGYAKNRNIEYLEFYIGCDFSGTIDEFINECAREEITFIKGHVLLGNDKRTVMLFVF